LSVYHGKTLTEQDEVIQEIKQGKLANALCGAAEVYMTDLRCVLERDPIWTEWH